MYELAMGVSVGECVMGVHITMGERVLYWYPPFLQLRISNFTFPKIKEG